jgi:hypothetical protein
VAAHTYGSVYHSAFPGSGSLPGSDAAFATIVAVGFIASASTLIADSQDDGDYISSDTGDILFAIPDGFIPDGATSVSVTIGFGEQVLVVGLPNPPTGSFIVKTGGTTTAFSAFNLLVPASGFTEHTSGARTTNANGVTLTGALFKASTWGVRIDSSTGSHGINQCVLTVTYTNPAVVAGDPLTGREPIGQMARLNVLRLGASRLAAIADGDNVIDASGLYEWSRGTVLTGPDLALSGGWTREIPGDPDVV